MKVKELIKRLQEEVHPEDDVVIMHGYIQDMYKDYQKNDYYELDLNNIVVEGNKTKLA